MARKRPQESAPNPDERRDTEQIRLDVQFLRRVRLVANGMGMSPGQYIETRLASIVSDDFAKVTKDLGFDK